MLVLCRRLRERVYVGFVQKAEGKGVQDTGGVASGGGVTLWLQQQQQYAQRPSGRDLL